MKWKMAFLGHEVVHDGEDSFFHLTSILRAENDHFSLLEIKGDASIAVNIGNVLVSMELASVENVVIGSIGEIFLKFFFSRSDEHVAHEKSVIGAGADNSDTDSFFEVESGVSVDDVEPLSGVEIISCKVFKDGK